MKTLIFIFLIIPSLAWSADYTISTSPVQDRVLNFEAQRAGKTKVAVIQELLDNYLKERMERLRDTRALKLREGYEALSPSDKKTVDGLISGVP